MLTNTIVYEALAEGHHVRLTGQLRRGDIALLVNGVNKATGRLTRAEPTIAALIDTEAGSRRVTIVSSLYSGALFL